MAEPRPTLREIEQLNRAACPMTDAELDAAVAGSGLAECYRAGFRDTLQLLSGQLERANREREARLTAARNRAACEAAYRGRAA